MDLLGGYDSNSSDDESDTANVVGVPKEPLPPPPPAPKATSKTNKRGKKLLKLQAVLPEHIWNQLSGGTKLDSDDDDDDADTPMPIAKPASKLKKDYSKDPDLLHLLEALPQSKNKKHQAPLLQDTPQPTILGAAFTTVTVERTTHKRSGTQATVVRNIHEEPTPDNDSEEDPPVPPAPRPTASVPQPPPRPSFALPTVRNAAPTISTLRRPPAPAATAASYPSYPGAAAAAPPPPTSNTTFKKQPHISHKRQMEQLLRAGKLQDVTETVSLEGPSNVYQPPAPAQQQQYQSHGIRVVPTTRYNVGMGQSTASMQVTGRQRGKHQLNSLLVSAAALEAQRARNPMGDGGTNSSSGSSHRVNAKRKYGW